MKSNKKIILLSMLFFISYVKNIYACDCSSDFDFSLSSAVESGELERVKELIENGYDVDSTIYYDIYVTPLMYASKFGYEDIAKFLIDNGADVDIEDHFGYTALMIASSNGHAEIVKLLIDSKSDTSSIQTYINIENDDGDKAIDLAKKGEHKDIVEYLESHSVRKASAK